MIGRFHSKAGEMVRAEVSHQSSMCGWSLRWRGPIRKESIGYSGIAEGVEVRSLLERCLSSSYLRCRGPKDAGVLRVLGAAGRLLDRKLSHCCCGRDIAATAGVEVGSGSCPRNWSSRGLLVELSMNGHIERLSRTLTTSADAVVRWQRLRRLG